MSEAPTETGTPTGHVNYGTQVTYADGSRDWMSISIPFIADSAERTAQIAERIEQWREQRESVRLALGLSTDPAAELRDEDVRLPFGNFKDATIGYVLDIVGAYEEIEYYAYKARNAPEHVRMAAQRALIARNWTGSAPASYEAPPAQQSASGGRGTNGRTYNGP